MKLAKILDQKGDMLIMSQNGKEIKVPESDVFNAREIVCRGKIGVVKTQNISFDLPLLPIFSGDYILHGREVVKVKKSLSLTIFPK